MDIVQERLEREYDMHLITTAPSVVYEVLLRDGTVEQVSNPARLPDPTLIEEIREPVIATKIFVPQEFVGPVITLCTQKRGTQTNMHYSARHVVISYDLPLNEVVLDFFDRLKSMTRGYGSLDYEFKEYRAADMVRLDILVNAEGGGALSSMVPRAGASSSRGFARSSRGRCSTSPSRPRLAATSWRARTSRRCARTCSPNATAAT
jgi:GTP-binding protein LepA